MARSHNELDHFDGSIRRSVAMAIALVAVVSAGSAAAAETDATDWDQEAVAGIAKSLAESLVGVETALRNEPGNAMPTGDRRSFYDVKQDLRRLRQEARHLARQLEAGDGREQTLNVFLRVQQLAHRAGENGKRAALTKPTLDTVAKARESLTKLAPYYGETWTPVMNPR